MLRARPTSIGAVYLIGHSMAAHAVWNIAIHYPTYFATINPLAGSADQSWQRIRLGDLREHSGGRLARCLGHGGQSR